MKSVRDWAAPRKAIVPRTEELGVFVERLGTVIYGVDWKPAKQATSDKLEVDTPAAATAFVYQQILDGIAIGRVRLQTTVSTDALAARQDPEPEKEANTVKRRRPALADDSENDDNTSFWRFREGFWGEPPHIDWLQSSVAVTGADLIRDRDNELLSDLFVVPGEIAAYIRVVNPDALIISLITYDRLPEPEWFERYREYADISTRELVAAAWRYLAMTGASVERGLNQRIVKAMTGYASAPGLSAGEETVKELARKIAFQLNGKDFQTRVFVNSVRTRAAKPK